MRHLASRQSLESATGVLLGITANLDDGGLGALGQDLHAVAGLLSSEPALRRTLSDNTVGPAAKTGLAQWLVDATLGGLPTTNIVALIALISGFTVLIHLVVPIAPVIVAVVVPPIVLLAQAAGVNPALYVLPVVFTASCAFLLPLDAVMLVTYSRGYYRMLDMVRPGLVISLAWIVLMTALMALLGHPLGLF